MNVFRSSVKDINGVVLEETDITLKKGKKHKKKQYYKEFIRKIKYFMMVYWRYSRKYMIRIDNIRVPDTRVYNLT